jgi:hypothetical protein
MNGNEAMNPRWPPFGLTRQRIKYAPIAWVGGAPQVPELAGKRFYFYSFAQVALVGLGTGEGLVVTDRPFWAVALVGQGVVAGAITANSFRAQLADQGVLDDRRDRIFHQNAKSIPEPLAFSTGAAPFVFPVPHFIPPNHPIALRVVNLNAAANLVDVALFGYVNSPLEGWKVDDGGIRSDPSTDRTFPGMT